MYQNVTFHPHVSSTKYELLEY